MSKTRAVVAIASAATLAVGVATVSLTAHASPKESTEESQSQDHSTNNAPDINVDGVKHHLQKFQTIADDNGGNRAAGTSGYQASADYVAKTLDDAGFNVTRQTCGSCDNSEDENVIADWPGGETDNTIMIGGHLDSVADGPGIDDNGSGSAAVLQIALTVAENNPELKNHMRFAWWAEEELGMHGSKHYIDNTGVDDIAGYINLDMVAGTNAGYFIDNMSSPTAVAMVDHFDSIDKPAEEFTDCCSDNGPFTDAGVESTLLTTGYGESKTQEQADKWGGEAGEPYDPCYHTACDTYPDNINAQALDHMTDAAAQGLWDNASKTNRYNPVEICGQDYSIQEREAVTTESGTELGQVYMLWSNDAEQNCAVTIKTTAAGVETQTAVTLAAESGDNVSDKGAFAHYAGPVKLDAKGTCVKVDGSIAAEDGTVGTGSIPLSHCG